MKDVHFVLDLTLSMECQGINGNIILHLFMALTLSMECQGMNLNEYKLKHTLTQINLLLKAF